MFQDGASKNGGADMVEETAEVEPCVLRFTATPRAFETPTLSKGARKLRRR